MTSDELLMPVAVTTLDELRAHVDRLFDELVAQTLDWARLPAPAPPEVSEAYLWVTSGMEALRLALQIETELEPRAVIATAAMQTCLLDGRLRLEQRQVLH